MTGEGKHYGEHEISDPKFWMRKEELINDKKEIQMEKDTEAEEDKLRTDRLDLEQAKAYNRISELENKIQKLNEEMNSGGIKEAKMNKKQLIAVWIMVILLSIIALTVDYENFTRMGFTYPGELIKFGFPVVLIGALLIYTLRGKKK